MSRVAELLEGAAELYRVKAKGYAPDPNNPWENFHETARLASRMTGKDFNHIDIAVVMFCHKVSRLQTLTVYGEHEESPDETLKDATVYAPILRAMLEERK